MLHLYGGTGQRRQQYHNITKSAENDKQKGKNRGVAIMRETRLGAYKGGKRTPSHATRLPLF